MVEGWNTYKACLLISIIYLSTIKSSPYASIMATKLLQRILFSVACNLQCWFEGELIRGGSRTAPTSKMERFAITVNGWKPLTIITKRFILDDAAVLYPPLG